MPWEFKLDGWPGVVGGFLGKTRRPNQGSFHEAPELIEALGETGASEWPLIEAEQVHGSEIAAVGDEALGDALNCGGQVCLPGMDGLLTDQRGALLAIYVADCLAIYLHHRARPAVGLAHAGWRGLAKGIGVKLVRAALDAYGGNPGDLAVLLSPCIGPCCFEVSEDVAGLFEGVAGAVDRRAHKPHVDLRPVAMAQLENAGVALEQMEARSECTRCNPERFASYRAEGENCGTNVALIGLNNGRLTRRAGG